ncbi:hypothetical protein [Limibacillus sp. MBR-115]|uniref:hypothetical protein n=1 Tax=Limibacillus sp. MBR-115 TaxID=3156465 RepID=UPI003395240F
MWTLNRNPEKQASIDWAAINEAMRDEVRKQQAEVRQEVATPEGRAKYLRSGKAAHGGAWIGR